MFGKLKEKLKGALSVFSKKTEEIAEEKEVEEKVKEPVEQETEEQPVKEKISEFGGEVGKVEEEPIAFGLIALKVSFIVDEDKGDTEPLENGLKEIDGVANADVVGVTRTLG